MRNARILPMLSSKSSMAIMVYTQIKATHFKGTAVAILNSFANHLLIAMPSLKDPNFEHAVIYVCEHSDQGTVGLIINRPMQYPLKLVFDQMNIESPNNEVSERPLLFGGPVQPERGFVIHRPSGVWRSSLSLEGDVTVTTSNDIIHSIALGNGPQDAIIALGYTGWGEKQLDEEVRENRWLVCPFLPRIMYEVPYTERWRFASESILGIRVDHLSSEGGEA